MAAKTERAPPAWTLSRDTAAQMADGVLDRCPEWRDCTAFPTQHDRGGHAVRVGCLPRDRASTGLPAAIKRWIRKTPAFTLDNPRVDTNRILWVDIVPTQAGGDGEEGRA